MLISTKRRDPGQPGAREPRRLWRHKGGNIAVITALMMIPLTFALGMAFDFTLSQTRKDQLDGIADAAALGAVTPTEMALACSPNATAQSTSLFGGQETSVAGVQGLAVTVSGCPDVTSGTTVTRKITVSYTAQSQNVFGSLLGMTTLPIKGSSTATSSTAPNINFYLLLDTSPSMELAATTAGISTMEAVHQSEPDTPLPGCAFACHQSDAASLTGFYNTATGAPIVCTASGFYADGTAFAVGSNFPTGGRDSYDLSRCLGVTLRIDLLRTAVQNLVTTADTTEATDKATYGMALYATDVNQSNSANDLSLYTLLGPTPSTDLSTGGAAYTAAGNITPLEVYGQNLLTSSDNNDDMDTSLDSDVSSMNTTTILPTPGSGGGGQAAQEVLFIVTDGLNDTTPTRTYAPLDWNGTICSAIKARGIRIAVLYTTYYPLTNPTGWYESVVLPALPTGLPPDLPPSTPVGTDPMALGAQQCASPGLFYEVSTNGDISSALQTLFQEAVATARLSQ